MATKVEAAYDRKAATALVKTARELKKRRATWIEANNTLFGIDSKFASQFPTRDARKAFHAGSEFAEIRRLLAELQLPHETTAAADAPSGKFLLRLPKSLHAALQAEAEAEGVSLNQLALSKLAVGLRQAVGR